jgi:ribonucleotide monophosphatase NagD (HAD superfamily)
MNDFATAIMLTDDILENLMEIAATVQAQIPELCSNPDHVTPMQLGAFFASEAMIARIKQMKQNASDHFTRNSAMA